MRAFGRLQPYLTPRGFICRKCARRIATDSRAFEGTIDEISLAKDYLF
jgi:hypothetical protein